jgi:hypothetical protein
LPEEYDIFINQPPIASLSCIINLIFSFAALETTHPFPRHCGPQGFMAIQGKIYHRVRPTHQNSAVHWLLFEGFAQNMPHPDYASSISPLWIDAVRNTLFRVNPFVHALHQLHFQMHTFPMVELIWILI